jgi:ketosteroid isomerase-like protein
MPIRLLQTFSSVLIATTLVVPAQEPLKPKLTPRIITATRQVTLFTGLEKQMLAALQKKDKAALAALLAEECTIELPDADPLAGEDWIDSVMAKDFSLKSFVIRQMSVADLGDSAVVKFERSQQATLKGKDDSGEFFVVDLWKKNGDSWKLANRYVARVRSAPPSSKRTPKPSGKE